MCTVCMCARSPTTLEARHQADVKIVMLKFVVEVWLKYIDITTTKKGHQFFYGEKIVEAPPKQCTLPRQVNPALLICIHV